MNRLCVTMLNNSESLPSLSLECPVLTQKNDSPLSVGSCTGEASVGKYQRFPFRKQALIKPRWKGWRETLSAFLACTCACLFPFCPRVRKEGCSESGPPRLLLFRPCGPSSTASSHIICVLSLRKEFSALEPGIPSVFYFSLKKLLLASHLR